MSSGTVDYGELLQSLIEAVEDPAVEEELKALDRSMAWSPPEHRQGHINRMFAVVVEKIGDPTPTAPWKQKVQDLWNEAHAHLQTK